MKHKICRLTKKGQLVVPKAYRDTLGITEKTDLSIHLLQEGAIEIRPVRITPLYISHESDGNLQTEVVGATGSAAQGKAQNERCSEKSKDEEG